MVKIVTIMMMLRMPRLWSHIPTCARDQQWRLLLGGEIACRELHSREFHRSLKSHAGIHFDQAALLKCIDHINHRRLQIFFESMTISKVPQKLHQSTLEVPQITWKWPFSSESLFSLFTKGLALRMDWTTFLSNIGPVNTKGMWVRGLYHFLRVFLKVVFPIPCEGV